MGRWTDIATWAGPIPNGGPGRMSAHMGVVIHTAEGSYDGTIAWQRNPSAQIGSHFVTAQDGRVVQLIDTDTRSWCQSAGNDAWLSIENAGYGSRGESLTSQQVEICARILARAHREYGVPLQVTNSPSVRGLGWHGMGGAAWGGHYDCPGTAIRAQLPTIVARAAQIIGGSTMDQAQETELLRNAHNSDWGVTQILQGTDPAAGFNQMGGGTFVVPNKLHQKLDALKSAVDGIQAGGQPTDAQVDAAVLKALQDPTVLKGIGDAIAAHIHVT